MAAYGFGQATSGLSVAGSGAFGKQITNTIGKSMGKALWGYRWSNVGGGELVMAENGYVQHVGANTRVLIEDVRIASNKATSNVLSRAEYLRIENAATRINKPITVVGSRATRGVVVNDINTLKNTVADWDYVIPGLTSKNWSTIKNSLPGARSIIDNTPRNIDIFKIPVNTNLPHITIYPR